MKAIILDLDGTLCDHKHRIHLSHRDFDAYNSLLEMDTPNPAILTIVQMMGQLHPIIIITGRPEQYRQQTVDWLRKYKVPYIALHMRPTGDMRGDAQLKEDIHDAHLLFEYTILFALEDRDCVVGMWRSRNITCLQVDRFEVAIPTFPNTMDEYLESKDEEHF